MKKWKLYIALSILCTGSLYLSGCGNDSASGGDATQLPYYQQCPYGSQFVQNIGCQPCTTNLATCGNTYNTLGLYASVWQGQLPISDQLRQMFKDFAVCDVPGNTPYDPTYGGGIFWGGEFSYWGNNSCENYSEALIVVEARDLNIPTEAIITIYPTFNGVMGRPIPFSGQFQAYNATQFQMRTVAVPQVVHPNYPSFNPEVTFTGTGTDLNNARLQIQIFYQGQNLGQASVINY